MMTLMASSPTSGRRTNRSTTTPRMIATTTPKRTAATSGRLQDDERRVEHVGADEQELALGEVDDAGGLVDEDESQRREREERAVGQAVDGQVMKVFIRVRSKQVGGHRPSGTGTPERSTMRGRSCARPGAVLVGDGADGDVVGPRRARR